MPDTSDWHAVTLPDGRRLSYAEYGAAAGFPVLYFHGLPGSRIEACLMHKAAVALGSRLIAVDRPGIGRSDYSPRRRIIDWPVDVIALADLLGCEHFAILAVSGGAPYALVCAARIPERLTSVSLVGGLAPLAGLDSSQVPRLARLALGLIGTSQRCARLLAWFCAWRFHRDADSMLGWIAARMPPADSAALSRPAVRRALAESFTEAVCQSSRGVGHELILLTGSWGFSLADVRVPAHLWHGKADAVVPVALGRYLAERLPNCQANFLAGEGHYSLPLNYTQRILKSALGSR